MGEVPEFGLSWPGKRDAFALAEVGPTSTLVDVPADGTEASSTLIEAESTTSLHTFIEGDNLEVLRHLAATQPGSVRLIYLDPPYNTGNPFVYRDDHLRGHAQWLSMMAPRLVLARRVLADDGVIIVSIDSGEVHHLALLIDEVFGESNRLNSIAWVSNLRGRQLTEGGPVGTHEHLLVHAKDARQVGHFRGSLSALHRLMPAIYKRSAYPLKHDATGPYVTKNQLHNTNSKFNERTAGSLVYRIHHHPATGEVRVTDIDDETTFDGFVTALPHRNAREGLT